MCFALQTAYTHSCIAGNPKLPETCLVDAFRAMGIKVPYERSGRFWAVRAVSAYCVADDFQISELQVHNCSRHRTRPHDTGPLHPRQQRPFPRIGGSFRRNCNSDNQSSHSRQHYHNSTKAAGYVNGSSFQTCTSWLRRAPN